VTAVYGCEPELFLSGTTEDRGSLKEPVSGNPCYVADIYGYKKSTIKGGVVAAHVDFRALLDGVLAMWLAKATAVP
jgi:hypothetical protein